ncbi:MAG: hypothetical protein ABIQ04_01165 [Candidatus Saccharimonadales bacterium]
MDEQKNITPTPAQFPEPTPVSPPETINASPSIEPAAYQPQPIAPAQEFNASSTPANSVTTVSAPVISSFTQPSPAPSQPIAAPESFPPVESPKKKSNLLWLWITIGVVFLLAVITAVLFFVSKQNADKVADDYTKSVSSYVDKIHTDVGASASASDAKKDLDNDLSKKPVLKTAFLSSFSDKYKKATELQKTVETQLGTFDAGINDLAGVDSYINHNKENYTKITTAISTIQSSSNETTVLSAMNDALSVMKDAQTSTESAVFPTELATTKTSLINAYKDETKYWQALIDARKAKDSTAYEAALKDFTTASDDESTALDTVNTYYYSLSTKRNDLLDKLDSFHKDLV